MPLDILLEIFSHLKPYDLLRLARSTKALRAILFDRSSAFVWRSARQRIKNLPPCPLDISEPAFANLMFDPHCYNCGRTRGIMTGWYFCRNFCSDCYHFGPLRRLGPTLSLIDFAAGEGIPQDKVCLEKSCLPLYRGAAFLPSEMTSTLKSSAALEIKQAKKAWIKESKAKIEQRLAFDAHKPAWDWGKRSRHEEELRIKKERRRKGITDCLLSEGWGDVLRNLDREEHKELYGHRSFKSYNFEVTDRVWNNIKKS